MALRSSLLYPKMVPNLLHRWGKGRIGGPHDLTWDSHCIIRQQIIKRGYDDAADVCCEVQQNKYTIENPLPPPKRVPVQCQVAGIPAWHSAFWELEGIFIFGGGKFRVANQA